MGTPQEKHRLFRQPKKGLGRALGIGVQATDTPIRLYLGKYASVRIEARDYGFFDGLSPPENELYASASFALSFGGGDE